MPFWRDSKTRPNVCAHEIQTAAATSAGENIESGFEPVVEPVSDFDCFVPGVISRRRSVISLLRSFGSEVVVQLDHGYTARNGLGSIDLDFIIVLGRSDRCEEADEGEAE